jgi:hypothetical protein
MPYYKNEQHCLYMSVESLITKGITPEKGYAHLPIHAQDG